MKRSFFALALAGMLTLGLLAGCGGNGAADTPTPENSAPVQSDTPAPLPESSTTPEPDESVVPDAGGQDSIPDNTPPLTPNSCS